MLAEEADIRRHRDDTFRAITNRFAINLNILAVEMASWHGADNVMALLAMKRRKMTLTRRATLTVVLQGPCRTQPRV